MNNNFEKRIIFRLFKSEVKEIDKLVRKNPIMWDNRSHFVRAACVYFLNDIKTQKFKLKLWE